MSQAPLAVHGQLRYQLWIADRDENGTPVDTRFISAAYKLAPQMFRYRRSELDCESVTAMLIQAAVNAASRAAHDAEIENPSGYLLTVFTRKADRHLARLPREQAFKDDFLEDEANSHVYPDSVTTTIHNRILAEQALRMMPADVRELCDLHIIHGVSMKQIAEMKGEPGNRLAVRLSRGLRRVADALSDHQHIDKRKSQG